MLAGCESWIGRAGLAAFCLGTFVVAATSLAADELPANHPRRHTKGAAFQLKQFQVATGNKEAAQKYYREVVSTQMKFETPETIENTTIKNLVTYFGHTNINASDLHRLSSDELMALSADGDILATRFFAPKISDVQEKPAQIPEGGFGWRKLVRLKAKAGSLAETNGVEFLYILQNIFEGTATGDPFNVDKNVSKFNQVIATRKIGSGPYTGAKQASYFLTYGRLVKVDSNKVPIKVNGEFQEDGILIFNLEATFDEDDRDPESNTKPKEYFVPDSCVQCHGGVRNRAKLNYLDTDHWVDRVKPAYGLADPRFAQEDFTALAQAPFGVLYDGGKDTTTSKFKNAFDVIRKLNEDIKTQNTDIGGGNNFQLAAVTKWLELHTPGAADNKHVPPHERGFGLEIWNSADNSQRTLLYYLNRYCYRCHSSVRFNVFDRKAVRDRADQVNERVIEISQPDLWMPQDRIFPGLIIQQGVPEATGELKEFLDLLQQLQ
jgi:hypothetical protein